jgi:peptide deformylase
MITHINSNLPILIWPNEQLSQCSQPVLLFDDKIKQLSNNLIHTMKQKNGIGLAAPQCGIHLNIIAVSSDIEPPTIIINPRILEQSDMLFQVNEGCLSVPGYYEHRSRPKNVHIEYQDINRTIFNKTFENLMAFCIQHEIDHLYGKLFIDNASQLKKDIIRRKINKTLRHQ